MIGNQEGVTRARTVRRKATNEDRWDREKLDEVTTTPWNAGQDHQRDEDIKIEVPGQEEEVRKMPATESRPYKRRNFHITEKDVRKEGRTPGCPGCMALCGMGSDKRHTPECRTRFEDLMVQNNDPRIERWLIRMAEEMQERIEQEGSANENMRDSEREPGQEEKEQAESRTEEMQDADIEDNEDQIQANDEDDVVMAVMGKEQGREGRKKG